MVKILIFYMKKFTGCILDFVHKPRGADTAFYLLVCKVFPSVYPKCPMLLVVTLKVTLTMPQDLTRVTSRSPFLAGNLLSLNSAGAFNSHPRNSCRGDDASGANMWTYRVCFPAVVGISTAPYPRTIRPLSTTVRTRRGHPKAFVDENVDDMGKFHTTLAPDREVSLTEYWLSLVASMGPSWIRQSGP